MKTIVYAVCLAMTVGVCTAHLCLISPQQRGNITGLETPGSNDCLLLKGPCGGRPAGDQFATYRTMSTFPVIFQKNLDHWNKATPGHFTVNLWKDGTMVGMLAKVDDKGEKSLSLYEPMITLPAAAVPGKYIIQVQYVTMNQQAPPVFYQCADVVLI